MTEDRRGLLSKYERNDVVDVRVRQLYERFPYPTPTTDLRPFMQGDVLELGFPRTFFHKYWPCEAQRDDLDILVAGCGSSQAARYAAAHPRARVTGIDFSEASLRQTRTIAERHGLENLRLRRLGVEDAHELDDTFDLVVCTGVIHHLPEPARGLQALRERLRPHGTLYWMVYAPCGRDAVYYLQGFLATLGMRAEDFEERDIGVLQGLLEHLPRSHPLWHRREGFPDLMNAAELVDYLLHPRDKPYYIRECFDLARQCGLRVMDLFNRAHYQIRRQSVGDVFYRRWLALDEEARLAAGERYRAALIRHDLIACRDDRPVSSYQVSTETDWHALVPIKAPGLRMAPPRSLNGETIISWPGHAFDDISLSVDQNGYDFLKAVDGERSLAAIQAGLRAEIPAHWLGQLRDYDYLWFKHRA